MFHLRTSHVALLCLCVTLAVPPHSAAQSATKRLILKDGSYQIATKWEVKGDRVRYYSSERAEWEEVPDSLVDWQATDQYAKDRAEGKMSPDAVALDKELEEAREEEERKSPHVAPGLRLPPEGGVYALDTYLTQPQLVPLDQSNGEINKHVARNVLRSAINPVAGAKHTIELAGPSSRIQMHAALPAIYINLDANADEEASSGKNSAELPWDRFRIVRSQVKGDRRIVSALKTAVYGKASQEQDAVAASAEQLGEGWVKLTPKEPLAPGEYAVAEMLGKQGMNSYVWDFGVHPNAPANLAVIKPEVSHPSQPTGSAQELEKRP